MTGKEESMRRYRVNMGQYDIGRWEFQAVEALARRYNSNKRRAAVLSQSSAPEQQRTRRAMEWEVRITDQALRDTSGGGWERALRSACCDGWRYEDIDPALMPTANRNAFFEARREFYWRLWTIRQETIGSMIGGGI